MPRRSTTHNDRCCNPYLLPGEVGHKGKSLRNLPVAFKRQYPDIPENSKICYKCRRVFNENLSLSQNALLVPSENELLDNGNEIQMNDEESSNENNSVHLKEDLEPDVRSQRETELEEFMNDLKEKFSSLQKHDPERLRILTICPISWSVRKTAREFNCSRNLASRAKELKKLRGTLAATTAISRNRLSEDVVENVKKFYESDINSKEMPGKKDKISIKTDDGRVSVQKRLLLLDLRGLYTKYEEQYSEHKVSFSKFAELRPKHCILMGASGTHSVCVCTIHQNIKLMVDAINLKELTRMSEESLCTYKDCLKQIICKNPSDSCYLDDCENCPSTSTLSQTLRRCLENNSIYNVQFSSWTGTDRSTLQCTVLPSEDFIEVFCDKLLILKPHSFIAKQQAEYVENKKSTLRSGEILISLDFAENYKYVAQDASQAFHFNNDQCTVFTVVCYYNVGAELKHKSFIFLSDSTKHDAAAVYTIQRMLIPEINKEVKVMKIIYVSDGAKQHFKNKFQIINLVHHQHDFGVIAEWHFHATAHGKSACDGIGATFKREATRASLLAKPSEAILDSKALFKWGRNHFKNVSVLYYSKVDHGKMQRHLNKRFSDAPAVPEIQKSHCFITFKEKKLLIKKYSNAPNGFEIFYT